MKLPPPQPGLVIRYSYLWAREAAQGHEEGAKERPAAVAFGYMTPGFFAKMRDRWLDLDAAGKSLSVPRDDEI